MKLKDFFSETSGIGILSTSNGKGEVNSAVYAIPHVTNVDTVQFIMRDRLTRANLQENNKACYLFMEQGQRSKGVRLYLSMTGEDNDKEKIEALSRRPSAATGDGDRFLATFKVEKVLTLIGGDDIHLQK